MSGADQSLASLRTLDDVSRFVREGMRATATGGSRWHEGDRSLEFGFEWGRLPLPVAECGPLVERAVAIAGRDGLTLQQIRRILTGLGEERVSRGLAFARESGRLIESHESRPNRSGREQEQVVLRAAGGDA